MKRFLIITILAAAFWACTQSDEPQVPQQTPDREEVPMGAIRTPEEARECAVNAFATFYGMSRAIPVVKGINAYGSKGLSRSESLDTAFYVVNLMDNQGYAVIDANADAEPVLAVTESGNIESLDSIENPGVQLFFNCLSAIKPGDPKPNPDLGGITQIKQFKEEVKNEEFKVTPRADFHWGQLFPENKYMPNNLAGCGNIATLLTFSYFEQPKKIVLDNGTIDIDWSLIKKHRTSKVSLDNCGENEEQRRKIHTLIGMFCKVIAFYNLRGCFITTVKAIHQKSLC